MTIAEKVMHIYEPDDLQCGQAVIAMLTGLKVPEVVKLVGTERETTLKQMKTVFAALGIEMLPDRREAFTKNDLPDIALLSLETPRCWHWSLYFKGKFLDPEHGVLDDFPSANRKYFWEIIE